MALDYTTVDGWPVAPNTADAFLTRLKPAFEAAFPGVTLHVYSGYRSYEGQVEIFTSRYRRGAYSPYGDYRTWDGSTWGRVSGEGTVAAPGTSNHQSGHALDIRDSGSDAGVTIAGNARANWIRANAAQYGFNAIGYTFAEPWHIEYTGDPWAATTGAGGETTTAGGGSAAAPSKGKIKMEAYVLAPNGVVVHLRAGGKTNFKSAEQYAGRQALVKKLRAAGATNLVQPPTLKKVPSVTWAQFEELCDAIGAPKD